ncbi:MAG: type II secretion system F family protein [Coriobacteriales bacterium]|jgi:tight adherence protein B|nr:type II secretion system F family protein [Coriobacteriales bacterium]
MVYLILAAATTVCAAGFGAITCVQELRRLIHIAESKAVLCGAGQTSLPQPLLARIRYLAGLLVQDRLRNGVPFLAPLTNLCMRWGRFRRSYQDAAFSLKGVCPETNPQALAQCILAVSFACALLMLIWGQPALAILALFAPSLLLDQFAKHSLQRRQRQLREQLPEALQSLAMAFLAGYSLQQALAQSAREVAEPLASELGQTVDDIKAGKSPGTALGALCERVRIDDLRFVTVALEIQHRSGGSIKDLLDHASASINQQFELERSLAVGTAQARLSAKLVTVLPLLLVVVLSLLMPGYLQSFFSGPLGFAILLTAVALEAVGIFLIRHILKVGRS